MCHNEQAILVFTLEAEMAGKDAAIRQPRLRREAHVDAGFGMASARQCRDLRGRTAAEYPHRGGGIGAHIQQATAAKLPVIAKIGDRQGWDDELGINVGERAIFADKPLQRLEMRVITKHGSLGENTPGAARFAYAALAPPPRDRRRLVDEDVLAGGASRKNPMV